MPGLLEISTVVGCKMKCSYCPQAKHVNTYAERSHTFRMHVPDFEKYISTVPKDVDIVFAGMAEPFLNKYAIFMVAASITKGHSVSIYTTCEGMDMGDASCLDAYMTKWPSSFKHVCVHLPDAEGKMRFKITDKYLEVLKRIMPLQNNLMCIGKLHPAVREIVGVDVEDGSHALYSRAGNIPSMAITPKKGNLFCSACTKNLNHNVLLPNGDVLLCCMDYGQDHIIGNLNRMNYEDLFKSEEYNRVIRGLKDESIDILCRKCEVSTNV